MKIPPADLDRLWRDPEARAYLLSLAVRDPEARAVVASEIGRLGGRPRGKRSPITEWVEGRVAMQEARGGWAGMTYRDHFAEIGEAFEINGHHGPDEEGRWIFKASFLEDLGVEDDGRVGVSLKMVKKALTKIRRR